MRRFSILLHTFALVLVLAACARGPAPAETQTPGPAAPVASAQTATPVRVVPTQTPQPQSTTVPVSPAATSTPTHIATLTPTPVENPQAAKATDPLADWDWKGMSMSPIRKGYFASEEFRQAIDTIAQLHVDSISLIIPYIQTDMVSTDIRPAELAPTDAELVAAIDYIHAKGMGVMIKPHMRGADGTWQLYFDPPDRRAWFRNYGAMILNYARIAQEHRVEVLSIGAELRNLTSPDFNPSNTGYWVELIGKVRKVYDGKLTFSAHWGPDFDLDEKNQITFWPLLDYIGISAYFDFYSETYDRQAIETEWARWEDTQIRPLHEKYGKQVIFTEIGYRSVSGTRFWPWDWELGPVYDEKEQAAMYDALFSYWSHSTYFKGVFIWEWRQSLPPGNKYYSPKGKLAQDVIAQWFGGKGVASPIIVAADGRKAAPGQR